MQDITSKLAQNRISRLWGECIELAKKIELLDPNYRVSLEAIKPEMERHARLGYGLVITHRLTVHNFAFILASTSTRLIETRRMTQKK